jgi:hypothetical protein
MEGANMAQAPMQQPIDPNAVAQIAAKAATEVVTKVANDLLSQLPGLVDKMLTARLDQITAGGHQAQQSQPQPAAAGGGRMADISQIAGLLQQFGLFKAEQPNPTNALVQQVEMLGGLITAIDRIRGNPAQPGTNMPPKTALEWAKWGYGLGKTGAPAPSFDTATVSTPPGAQV